MARKLRHCPKGGIFHLCNRAVLKSKMFFSEQEYREIELVLREALAKFPVSIFAYCIMPNHWHLLGRANEEKAISRFMHWFGTTQSKRWRTANETIGLGAVFQNRFRSHAVVGKTLSSKSLTILREILSLQTCANIRVSDRGLAQLPNQASLFRNGRR